MSVLFDYPRKAHFGRVLPKNKIYEYAGPNMATKELFVRQVEQITWAYKLAPETINVPATQAVSEIQIFSVVLKTGDLKEDVLRCIDKAIPFPIIFELSHAGKCRVIAAYKRPNDADSEKWVISGYFRTDWVPEDAARKTIPIALNLDGLYEELLGALISYPSRGGESLQARVERVESIRRQQQELTKTEDRLRKEIQFNRKVEINAEIRSMKEQLKTLTGADTPGKS